MSCNLEIVCGAEKNQNERLKKPREWTCLCQKKFNDKGYWITDKKTVIEKSAYTAKCREVEELVEALIHSHGLTQTQIYQIVSKHQQGEG
jgi:hypothetical protein